MKKGTLIAALSVTLLIGTAQAQESGEQTRITPAAERASQVGGSDIFTGHALINPLFGSKEATRATAGEVVFSPGPSQAEMQRVSPAFAHYTQDVVIDDLWNRPGLSQRDRSVVTLSALIAQNQTIEPPFHFRRALDNGVTPLELSELITHLAFYSGWANATSATVILNKVFEERGVLEQPSSDAS